MSTKTWWRVIATAKKRCPQYRRQVQTNAIEYRSYDLIFGKCVYSMYMYTCICIRISVCRAWKNGVFFRIFLGKWELLLWELYPDKFLRQKTETLRNTDKGRTAILHPKGTFSYFKTGRKMNGARRKKGSCSVMFSFTRTPSGVTTTSIPTITNGQYEWQFACTCKEVKFSKPRYYITLERQQMILKKHEMENNVSK